MDRNQCEGLTTTLTAGPGGRTAAIPALLLTFAGPLEAAGGNYSGGADLEPSVAPIDEGDDVAAIDRLRVELDYDPRNVDIRPVLGFSNRKTRRFDDAPTFCQWAPRIESKHRGASKYLGELCCETGRSDKAMRQLEILDDRGTSCCKKYSQLKRPSIRTRSRRVIPDIMRA